MLPTNRRELVRRLRLLGFEGPISKGGNHDYMIRGEKRLTIPNPHGTDFSGGFVLRLLRQAGISQAEWDEAGRR